MSPSHYTKKNLVCLLSYWIDEKNLNIWLFAYSPLKIPLHFNNSNANEHSFLFKFCNCVCHKAQKSLACCKLDYLYCSGIYIMSEDLLDVSTKSETIAENAHNNHVQNSFKCFWASSREFYFCLVSIENWFNKVLLILPCQSSKFMMHDKMASLNKLSYYVNHSQTPICKRVCIMHCNVIKELNRNCICVHKSIVLF